MASAAWLGAAEQQADKAVACSATVPAAAQTGAGVQFQAAGPAAGSLWTSDSIVGNLRFVPATGAGGFSQGSSGSEACRDPDETQFTHILTRNIDVMETGVTQGMWSALRAVQPTLPSVTFWFSGATLPAESLTWYEAVLFANLLSVQQGLTRCYYTDSGKTIPIDATNYTAGNYYCDFAANGYRLPAEGEREYFTRAGTTGAFSVTEPNYYTAGNCSNCTAGLMPTLESVAWFCANAGSTTHAVGTKTANLWNLKDVHGNVDEWCWDRYGGYPSGTATDYEGAGFGSGRVIRGGNGGGYPAYCRSACRSSAGPGYRAAGVGFRLLRPLSIAYDWDFGDGTAHGTTQNPTHAYATSGTYNWTMTLTMGGQACVQSGQIAVSSTCTAASIATHPASQTIASGSSATLTVVASGSAPFNYQWYHGASGNTSTPVGTDSYSYATAALTTTTSYWVSVTNGCGQADSQTATIMVTASGGPTITSVKAKTGKPGSLATIKGTNFGTNSKKVTVYVGTKKAKITGKMKSTQIKFKIPRVKKGIYDLYVVVNGKSSNKVSFQVK